MFPNFNVSATYGLTVPYRTPISPSLSNGTQIHIAGTPTGDRFEVNLKSNQDDIILHFNPRLNDRTLVLNTKQGSWGQEQRHSVPFQRGVRFQMTIVVTDRGFQISVNGSHICEFTHRSPMHLGQLVEVKGDITLESVQVYPGAMAFPQMGGHMTFPTPTISFPSGPSMTFPTPSVAFPGVISSAFPQPFVQPAAPFGSGGGVPSIQACRIQTGSRIFIRGFIQPNAQRFEINLLQGHSDSSDIAFHFNPRFSSRTIVKNHRLHGQWGAEENQPFPSTMPLMPGSPVDLQIICDPYKYTVLMNNIQIAEFYHKIPPGSVMAIQYKGDISVSGIGQL